MARTEIRPQQITKPIQLLASWLAGLAIVDGSFLTAAAAINTPDWVPGLLTIAAVANVPIFLVSLFLLQTKFGPEMQEDTYYSQYLEKKYSTSVSSPKPINLDDHFKKLTDEIVSKVEGVNIDQGEKVSAILKESEVEVLMARHEKSRALSELFVYPHLWNEVTESFGDDHFFREDVSSLVISGLATMPDEQFNNLKLTSIGQEVAKRLETKNKLWNQNHERHLRGDRLISTK